MRNKTMAAAVLFSTVTMLAWPVMASDAQDSARDLRGNMVIDARGNCVRTKWDSNDDPCAPHAKAEPKPAPVAKHVAPPAPPKPAPKQLSREDLTVYFDFNKSTLTADSRKKLDGVVATLKQMKEVVSVGVVGYTDEIGKDSYNQKLSEKRAKAVADYIISDGYTNTNVMAVRALGEADAKSDCKGKKKRKDKIACMSVDRRVELELQYYK